MDEQHPAHLLESLAADERLDPVADRVLEVADRVAGEPDSPRSRALRGEWLGHPLHPALTDLPIGFWTSSFVLDLVGGRRMAKASRMLVGAGLLSALPTAAAGLADLREREDQGDRRIGAAHAAANGVATLLYLRSFWHRLRGRRIRGVVTGLAGAAAATAGGYLGGHLAFGRSEPTAGDDPAVDLTGDRAVAEAAARADDAGIVDQQGAALSMSSTSNGT